MMGGEAPSKAKILATAQAEVGTEVATIAERVAIYRATALSHVKAAEEVAVEAIEAAVVEAAAEVTAHATTVTELATLHANVPSQDAKETNKRAAVADLEAVAAAAVEAPFKQDHATIAKRLATCLATAQSHARNAALMTIPDLAAEEVADTIIATVNVTIAVRAVTCRASAQLRAKIKATDHVVVARALVMVAVKRVI